MLESPDENFARLAVELSESSTVAQSAQQIVEFGMQTVNTQFELLLAKAHRWQREHDIPVSGNALRGHRPIFKAISSGSADKAAQQMERHIREWGQWMPHTHQDSASS